MENDAISRSALREQIRLMAKQSSLGGTRPAYISGIEVCRLISNAPALDVAPVVRCKDCRSSRKLTIKEMITFEPQCLVCLYPHGAGVSYPEYDMTERIVTPNDYCSYGRRRENGR